MHQRPPNAMVGAGTDFCRAKIRKNGCWKMCENECWFAEDPKKQREQPEIKLMCTGNFIKKEVHFFFWLGAKK